MDPFEQVWETSRHNSWSWGYPTALVLGVVVLIALSLIRKAALRRPLKVVAILAFAFVAAEFSAREIRDKWRLRGEWADTHKNQMTDAGWDALAVDGANLTLGPLLYGVQAALLFVAVAFVLVVIRRTVFPAFASKRRPDAPESDVAKSLPLSSSP